MRNKVIAFKLEKTGRIPKAVFFTLVSGSLKKNFFLYEWKNKIILGCQIGDWKEGSTRFEVNFSKVEIEITTITITKTKKGDETKEEQKEVKTKEFDTEVGIKPEIKKGKTFFAVETGKYPLDKMIQELIEAFKLKIYLNHQESLDPFSILNENESLQLAIDILRSGE